MFVLAFYFWCDELVLTIEVSLCLNMFLTFFCSVAVGGSGSGRARSDPTHQHHTHVHTHSHSAHQGANPGNQQYSTMECESPQSRVQGQSHQAYPQNWPEGQGQGGHRPGNNTHSQSHRHHGSHHHKHQSPPFGHSTGPPSASGSYGNSSLLMGAGFDPRQSFPAATGANISGRHVDIVPSHSRGNSSGGMDPPQIAGVNMQIPGYPAQFGQYNPHPQPTWPGGGGTFPFTLATTVETSIPSHEQTQRTSSERGDESPMVGVVVQQSPVASH